MVDKIQAFTHDVGNLIRYENRYTHESGVYYGNQFDMDTAGYRVPVERSVKNPPFQGWDRHTAYNYAREVGKVFTDDPYSIRFRSVNLDGNGKVDKVWYDYTRRAYISPDHTPFAYTVEEARPYEDNSENESLAKAYDRLFEKKASLGALLVEARQTIDMLALNAARVANFLLSLKKGRNPFTRSPAKRGNKPADVWLEIQYGWVPLASDVFDTYSIAVDALKKKLNLRGTGKGHASFDTQFPYGANDWECTVDVSHRSVVLAQVENLEASFLNRAGLSDPLGIAWEAVPWSFAVDWFVPVGKVLSATTALAGLTPLGGWTSCHRRYDLHAKRSNRETDWYGEYGKIVTSSGSYHEGGYEFTRRAFTGSNMPSVGFYADLTPWSTPRAENALALFSQLFGGDSPRR